MQGFISLHKPLTKSILGIDGIDGIAEKQSVNQCVFGIDGIDGIAEKKSVKKA